MALPLIPILLIGGVALLAAAGKKKGGGGWRAAGIPGLQVKGDGTFCTELRVGNLNQFAAWMNTPEGMALDAKLEEESVDAAVLEFFARLGCDVNYDMLVHRIDGATWTIAEFMQMMAGAALGPGASLFATLRLR